MQTHEKRKTPADRGRLEGTPVSEGLSSEANRAPDTHQRAQFTGDRDVVTGDGMTLFVGRKQARHWKAQPVSSFADFVSWLRLDEPVNAKDAARAYVAGRLTPTTTRHKGETQDCTGLHRNKRAVLDRWALTLDADADAGADFLDVLAATLPGARYVWHTTFSSTASTPRYRVVVLLSRSVTPAEFGVLARCVMQAMGTQRFDPSCDQPERLMYAPAAADPDAYAYGGEPGDPLDVDAWLDRADLLGLEAIADAPLPSVGGYDGPRYDELTPDAQRLVQDRLSAHRALWAGRFAEACTWDESQRDEEGRGWEALSRDYAYACARWCAAPWAGIDDWEAFHDDPDVLPAEIAEDEMCAGKFSRQLVLDKARTHGVDTLPDYIERANGVGTPADDFGPVEVEPAADAFALAVEREAYRLRVQDSAREKLARERLGTLTLPPLVNLRDFLAVEDEDAAYRVEGLWPTGGRVLLSAQYKTGKTTLMGNLIHSLVDGRPFLGEFSVAKAERVLLLDNELDERMLRSWLREHNITTEKAVEVATLRGRLSTFNILEPAVRAAWAQLLGAADVLVFDCLRPVLDALGLSEDKDAGRFLEALDELAAEAGIGELVLVHHMGHTNERSRGDSRILDWPDAVWKLVREEANDLTSPRYFSAYGRDVDQGEVRLAYSDFDRAYTINGGGRSQAKATDVEAKVLEFVGSNPGCGVNDVKDGVGGDKTATAKALMTLEADGRLNRDRSGQKHKLTLPSTEGAATELPS